MAEPGAWCGVSGGSLSAVRPTQVVWIDFRGESGLLSRDDARTVDMQPARGGLCSFPTVAVSLPWNIRVCLPEDGLR